MLRMFLLGTIVPIIGLDGTARDVVQPLVSIIDIVGIIFSIISIVVTFNEQDLANTAKAFAKAGIPTAQRRMEDFKARDSPTQPGYYESGRAMRAKRFGFSKYFTTVPDSSDAHILPNPF